MRRRRGHAVQTSGAKFPRNADSSKFHILWNSLLLASQGRGQCRPPGAFSQPSLLSATHVRTDPAQKPRRHHLHHLHGRCRNGRLEADGDRRQLVQRLVQWRARVPSLRPTERQQCQSGVVGRSHPKAARAPGLAVLPAAGGRAVAPERARVVVAQRPRLDAHDGAGRGLPARLHAWGCLQLIVVCDFFFAQCRAAGRRHRPAARAARDGSGGTHPRSARDARRNIQPRRHAVSGRAARRGRVSKSVPDAQPEGTSARLWQRSIPLHAAAVTGAAAAATATAVIAGRAEL